MRCRATFASTNRLGSSKSPTGLTNTFSKKVENHALSIALHYMHYNFCRTHDASRHAGYGRSRHGFGPWPTSSPFWRRGKRGEIQNEALPAVGVPYCERILFLVWLDRSQSASLHNCREMQLSKAISIRGRLRQRRFEAAAPNNRCRMSESCQLAWMTRNRVVSIASRSLRLVLLRQRKSPDCARLAGLVRSCGRTCRDGDELAAVHRIRHWRSTDVRSSLLRPQYGAPRGVIGAEAT